MRKKLYILIAALVLGAPGIAVSAPVFDDSGLSLEDMSLGDAAWGDINNDGYWDLAVTGEDSGGFVTYVYKNVANGDSRTFDEIKIADIGGFAAVVWGDYNNSGYVDLLVVGELNSPRDNFVARIYENNGSGNFTQATVTGLKAPQNANAVWSDFNNNGRMDIVIAGKDSCAVFFNNGNDSFTEVTLTENEINDGALAVGDYNNDGFQDLIISGSTGSVGGYPQRNIFVFKNDGGTAFSRDTVNESVLTSSATTNGGLALGDLNNNGLLDLVISGTLDNDNSILNVYENNSDYEFSLSTSLAGKYESRLSIADVNMDGFFDILVIGKPGKPVVGTTPPETSVYLNSGNLKFQLSDDTLIGQAQGNIIPGDYNNDGRPDLYVKGLINDGTSSTVLYENKVSTAVDMVAVSSSTMRSYYTENKLYLMWDAPDAGGKEAGYYYNFRVGTSEGAEDLVPARYGTPLLGNYLSKATTSTFIDVHKEEVPGIGDRDFVMVFDVSGNNYYWAIQSIAPSLGYSWSAAGGEGWSEEQVFIDTSPPAGYPAAPGITGEYTYEKNITFSLNSGISSDPETGIHGCYMQIKEIDSSGQENLVVDEDISSRLSETVWDVNGEGEYIYKGKELYTYKARIKARHGYNISLPTVTYLAGKPAGVSESEWRWDYRSSHYTSTGPYSGWSDWSGEITVLELLSIWNNLIRSPGSDDGYVQINYSLEKPAHVKIRVFNLVGELVATVLDKYVGEAGQTMQEKWHCRNNAGKVVASGVYYVNVQAGSNQDTGKVVIVK